MTIHGTGINMECLTEAPHCQRREPFALDNFLRRGHDQILIEVASLCCWMMVDSRRASLWFHQRLYMSDRNMTDVRQAPFAARTLFCPLRTQCQHIDFPRALYQCDRQHYLESPSLLVDGLCRDGSCVKSSKG